MDDGFNLKCLRSKLLATRPGGERCQDPLQYQDSHPYAFPGTAMCILVLLFLFRHGDKGSSW